MIKGLTEPQPSPQNEASTQAWLKHVASTMQHNLVSGSLTPHEHVSKSNRNPQILTTDKTA